VGKDKSTFGRIRNRDGPNDTWNFDRVAPITNNSGFSRDFGSGEKRGGLPSAWRQELLLPKLPLQGQTVFKRSKEETASASRSLWVTTCLV
jgi:hypothetical protein